MPYKAENWYTVLSNIFKHAVFKIPVPESLRITPKSFSDGLTQFLGVKKFSMRVMA